MPFLIYPPVAPPLDLYVALRRNGVLTILRLYVIQYLVAPISLVSKDITFRYVKMAQHVYSHLAICNVTLAEFKPYGIAKSINYSVDFCGLTAMTYTYMLLLIAIYSPFLAPALWGWAFTVVESIERVSISASLFKALNMASKVPSSRHLRKRLYAVFHDP